jgi:hypothetical protein
MDFKTIIQEKLKKISIKLNEDAIPGGKGDNKTPEDIAKKHGVSIEDIKKEIELGMKTEVEHSGDEKKQREVATDHVWEHPKYYSDKKHGLNANEKKLTETVTAQEIAKQESQVAQKKSEFQKQEAERLKKAARTPTQVPLGEDAQTDSSANLSTELPKEELPNTGVTPEQETKIKEFLTTNQGLDDTKFHAFVQSMGIDAHEAEELVYKIVYDLAQIINGGNTQSQKVVKEEINQQVIKSGTSDINGSLSGLEDIDDQATIKVDWSYVSEPEVGKYLQLNKVIVNGQEVPVETIKDRDHDEILNWLYTNLNLKREPDNSNDIEMNQEPELEMPLNETVSRITKTKMDLLKEAWNKVRK